MTIEEVDGAEPMCLPVRQRRREKSYPEIQQVPYAAIDDILLHGTTFETMCTGLKDVLNWLSAANLAINLTKCHFGAKEVPHDKRRNFSGLREGPSNTEYLGASR
eukprot:GHVP01009260.1.p3 GENE.GHVP01009260.1~~GHVP01009260.1.p3  ORF type:complete len:105 (-),score=16.58 GHVP01009260.1:1858-2172(-)